VPNLCNRVRRALVLVLVALSASRAHAQDVADAGRVAVIFAHLKPLDDVSGAPYVLFDDQTGGVKTYRVEFPNIIYHATPWLQGWGGFVVRWTDNQTTGNTRELRPYVGVKVFVPNSAHIHLYDWTRLEWRRVTNTESNTITREWRFRTRPGVEFPLRSRAWQPGTFYGLGNSELFVEQGFIDGVRFMSGAGYIRNDRLRIELDYVLGLSRSAPSDVARLHLQQLSSQHQVQLQGRTASQAGRTGIALEGAGQRGPSIDALTRS